MSSFVFICNKCCIWALQISVALFLNSIKLPAIKANVLNTFDQSSKNRPTRFTPIPKYHTYLQNIK